MDDRDFDNIIKGKLEHLEGEPYDPTALSDLHYRLAASAVTPWYANYRTELLVVSSIIIVTLLSSLYFRTFNDQKFKDLHDQIEVLRNDNQITEGLQKQILPLTSIAPDTVFIEVQNTRYLYQIEELNKKLSDFVLRYEQEVDQPPADYDNIAFLGSEKDIPEELLYLLDKYGLTRKEDGEVYLVSNSGVEQILPLVPESNLDYANRIRFDIARISRKEGLDVGSEKDDNYLPLKKVRELERHYMRGIGLNLGPWVGASKAFYDGGTGVMKPDVGIHADILLSPSLSIETGIKYNIWNYEIDDDKNLSSLNFPDIDPNLGELQSVELESYVLEIPVNLKYKHPYNAKTAFTTSLGYSPVLYMAQDFEYDYLLTLNAGDPLNSTSLIVNTGSKINSPKFYNGTINLSMGIHKILKNKDYLEISLQYKHGLTKMGFEGIQPKIVGLRTGYWFKVR